MTWVWGEPYDESQSKRYRDYHMTREQYLGLIARANGLCEMCRQPRRSWYHRFYVDHDHKLGARAVRGLICQPCNSRLAAIDAGKKQCPLADSYLARPYYVDLGITDFACPPDCGSRERHEAGRLLDA